MQSGKPIDLQKELDPPSHTLMDVDRVVILVLTISLTAVLSIFTLSLIAMLLFLL